MRPHGGSTSGAHRAVHDSKSGRRTSGYAGRQHEQHSALPLVITLAMVQVDNATPILPNRGESVTHGIHGTAARW